MLRMKRKTYKWLTTSLVVLGLVFLLGSILSFQVDWLQNADFLIRFAIFPGGLIAGGILFLINGCIEYYADYLPSKYRKRPNTRFKWEAIYDTEQMCAVESVLKQFVRSYGFRKTDAFQFEPDDQIKDIMQEIDPKWFDAGTLLQQDNPTSSMANIHSLHEYVDARIWVQNKDANTTAGKLQSGAVEIDRQARDHLANTICRYMDEALTAFDFDEEINEIRDATSDETVHFVVDSLWLYYDDCKDHLAGLSKPEWDYFQRLILLLESDAEVEYVRQRHWSIRQIVAGFGLIGFGVCVYHFGIGWHLFGFALLFGPISILLSYWRNHSKGQQNEKRLQLMPFSSFAELRAIRKTVSGFSKRKCPADAKVRRVHSRLMRCSIKSGHVGGGGLCSYPHRLGLEVIGAQVVK